MTIRLIQIRDSDGTRRVASTRETGPAQLLDGAMSTYELAMLAIEEGSSLADVVASRVLGRSVDLERAADDGRLLPPIDHPDHAHLYLTGTGLTHLGSAETRDKMHAAAASGQETDSIRMFNMGVDGGKPVAGEIGVQPEWFYKGDGSCMVATGEDLPMPAFAEDGSEEPEIAGVYLIDDDGVPRRLGFCLANEFSDHVTERGNYLWLAHSKLRAAALGPELLTGELPADIRGTSRIVRDGKSHWEKPFLTGESHMSHSLRNLEHHHFKYSLFRRPRDVHVHFFGTATLSYADGIRTREGDVFEIEASPFQLPLRNRLTCQPTPDVAVEQL